MWKLYNKIAAKKKGVKLLEISKERVQFLQDSFQLDGEFTSVEILNNGLINFTCVLHFKQADGKDKAYVAQKINTNVFKDVNALMSNIAGVTSYLREGIKKSGGDLSRETLHFRKNKDGKHYVIDEHNNAWRCYRHVGDVYSCNSIENAQVFYNAGKAFGNFQNALADYPAEKLYETIPNFHNTYSRFLDFKKAVEEDKAGRKGSVPKEIQFVLDREKDTHVVLDLIESGEIPIRVTHNDTKLNNILFDNETDEGICVIDLDTIMPGSALYDFGDSIRFGANTASEDEKDLSKVSLSLPLYKAYVEGYLSSAKDSLVPKEIELLPFSAKLMTFECGMRFLTDYLNGDTYFKTTYKEHNLVRCHTQFKLVADIEKKMDEMKKITMEAAT